MPVDLRSKLGLNVDKVDAASHIKVDPAICRDQCVSKYCTFVCPAHVYTAGADGSIQVEHDGRLECGTCLVRCRSGALAWHLPRAGFGIQYRFG